MTAWGLLILFNCFVFGPFVDLADEAHRYCSVHQRVEHVAAQGGSDTSNAFRPDGSGPAPDLLTSVRFDPSGPSSCHFTKFLTGRDFSILSTSADFAGIEHPTTVRAKRAPNHSKARTPVGILHLAPTSSPPILPTG